MSPEWSLVEASWFLGVMCGITFSFIIAMLVGK